MKKEEYMSHLPPTARSADEIQATSDAQPPLVNLPVEQSHNSGDRQEGEKRRDKERPEEKKTEEEKENLSQKDEEGEEREKRDNEENGDDSDTEDNMSRVMIAGDVLATGPGGRTRPRLTTSNSGADIMLGLETDDGKTAEVEIDSLESDELQPEEIPKGRVRKTSIVEKLHKSKESELIALSIMETAGQRQREFEKLISEHQELVQEISRTPSAENIVQTETGRDP